MHVVRLNDLGMSRRSLDRCMSTHEFSNDRMIGIGTAVAGSKIAHWQRVDQSVCLVCHLTSVKVAQQGVAVKTAERHVANTDEPELIGDDSHLWKRISLQDPVRMYRERVNIPKRA
jgi:hypothetical protein